MAKEDGLHQKYRVSRADGRDRRGQKHHRCKTFTLDLTHDPAARVAATAYAEVVAVDKPQLAEELIALVAAINAGAGT